MGQPMTESRPLHLRATVLPAEESRELWVTDGLITDSPVRGAETVPGAYVLPGLVDAHCHIGLGPDGAVDRETAISQARTDVASGVLLVRDAGVPTDTRWLDARDDVPKIIRCGRHIARSRRYIRNYAVEVEPDDLVAEVERQAAAGDGWVKVVGDWIDRGLGDLAPLWPTDVVVAAVARAHELGARVAVHTFAEEAVADWVAAGVDCVEHGTGLTDEVITAMAAQGTVLDPTLVQIDNFPTFAAQGEEKFPAYAKHMRDLYDRSFDTVGKCVDAGIGLLAGSDAGGLRPHGTIADEVALLARVAGAGTALGAASWWARGWLGAPAELTPGAPADLVLTDDDPRQDPTALKRLTAVVRDGRRLA
ncbi:amidohydrolase family protein [Propionibacteriaceae bacterium Y2011]|uniref:amidohydrolase family protein n=1 Tax=Microlunatus sp. Y2014 TaxID=3418488 RepID=UPI003B43ED14